MDVSNDASPSDQPTITPPHHPFNGRRDHLPRISNDNSTFNHNDVSLDVFDRDCNDSRSVDGHRDPAQGDDDDDDAEDIEGAPGGRPSRRSPPHVHNDETATGSQVSRQDQ